MDYLAEVNTYLLIMRLFGLGTAAEKDTVLSELKEMVNEDDCMLKGLYYDLLLSENNNNTDAIVNLRRMVDRDIQISLQKNLILKKQQHHTRYLPHKKVLL